MISFLQILFSSLEFPPNLLHYYTKVPIFSKSLTGRYFLGKSVKRKQRKAKCCARKTGSLICQILEKRGQGSCCVKYYVK